MPESMEIEADVRLGGIYAVLVNRRLLRLRRGFLILGCGRFLRCLRHAARGFIQRNKPAARLLGQHRALHGCGLLPRKPERAQHSQNNDDNRNGTLFHADISFRLFACETADRPD
ncbi:hypothetical protein SDC9_162384 [bioreactor metagenome]|uniref:Uncharacterized protein n=1 Tax=bioreactor metagenome TaxID=1076179 RepID=A0A645FKX9_9ZZZZ